MNWWIDFWDWAEGSQLGSTVVGGILVAILVAVGALSVSFIRQNWRSRIWGGLARFVRKALSVRPTTTGRLGALRREAERVGADRVTNTIGPELVRVREELEKAQASNEELRKTLESAKHNQSAHGKQIQQRRLPPPAPRWHLEMVEDRGDYLVYEIRNLMPNSVVLNARMETARGTGFDFGDAAFWEDLSGKKSGQFMGEVTAAGRLRGFEFVLEWLNEDQDLCSKKWWMPAEDAPF